MKESKIELDIRKYAESRGILFKKFVSPEWVKVPDRIMISLTGSVAFMEIKKPDGDVHPKQVRICAMLNGRNVPSCIVDSVPSACAFIDIWLDTQACPDLRGEETKLEFETGPTFTRREESF